MKEITLDYLYELLGKIVVALGVLIKFIGYYLKSKNEDDDDDNENE